MNMNHASPGRSGRFGRGGGFSMADGGGRLTGEGGLALPFVAVMMIVLLAFVAFAVDIGAAYAVRRQSQSAADSAVLGAAQEMLDTGSRAGSASYAKTLSHDTVAFSPSVSDWETDFATCTDSGSLAATAPAGGITSVWSGAGSTSCVSFSANNQRVRVRIPVQEIDASFARLVGFETFNVSTSAEAMINFTVAGGGALPYAITGTHTDSIEVCLNRGTSLPPEAGECEGGETGNFGVIDWSIYGNEETTAWGASGVITLDMATACSSKSTLWNATERVALNDMLGVDHPLGVYTTAVRNDRTICDSASPNPPNFFARPNEAPTETGNVAINGTFVGLVHGMTVSGEKLRGRFDRYCGLSAAWACEALYSGGPKANNERNGTGSPIDTTPLWELLATDLVEGLPGSTQRADGSFTSVPASCVPSAFVTNPTKAQLEMCLTQYIDGGYGTVVDSNGNSGTFLFAKDSDGDPLNGRWDIMNAPRFGFVPLLWDLTFPPGQSDPVRIKEFRPVYFQTMYLGCNSGSCGGIHNPGEPWSPIQSNKGSLDAISAIHLRPSMLPPEAREVSPTGDKELQITLVR